MKVNTYGEKIRGLKKAAAKTKGLKGYYDEKYVEIFYDIKEGVVWGIEQYDRNKSTHTRYAENEIIKIGNVYSPKKMQEIADMIIESPTWQILNAITEKDKEN